MLRISNIDNPEELSAANAEVLKSVGRAPTRDAPGRRQCTHPRSRLSARRFSLLIAFLLSCGLTTAAAAPVAQSLHLGRSQDGRPIVAVRAGDPAGRRVLVVGCIHGTECAGIAVAHALERVRTRLDLWIVPNLNPDGYARGTRQNGRGVDLNANWSSQWRG